MLTQIRHADPLGGPQGVGCYIATLTVDPSSWYFKAHFYQDPVTPGSLGLESFLQLAKVAIRDRWGVDAASNFLCVAPTREHQWVYRGQILPTDDTVTVTLTVDTWDDAQRIVSASGFLSVDGRVIYQCIDFTVQLA
jgi:3-hydroxymyristoyl/3-hydroxydecanoyl-(acyl carrier protein) dehydratase